MKSAFKYIFLISLGFLTHFSYAHDLYEEFSEPLEQPLPRHVRFNFVIENHTDKTLEKQIIWIYAPVKRTATQELQSLSVTMPYELEEDSLGNQIIKLSFDSFPAFGTKLVTIKADLLMSHFPRISRLHRGEQYLMEEQYIEKNDANIQTLAKRLQTHSPETTVLAFYQWVRSHLQYSGFIANDLGAQYAIKARRGDCTEYAYLLTALARASGLPARAMGGYFIEKSGNLKPNEFHNWAEVYIDGRWHLADAQKENFQTHTENYVATQIISHNLLNSMHDAHRFRVQGDVSVRMF